MIRTILVLLLSTTTASAQAERYELGARLKAFELAWEKQPDLAARKRALEIMPKVTTQFFAFQLGEAGRTLDEARFRLESKEPPADAIRWLTSLYAAPEKRLLDASVKELKVEVKAFYKMKGSAPANASAVLRFSHGQAVSVPLDKLPITVSVPFPREGWSGDWQLILDTTLVDKLLTTKTVRVSTLNDVKAKLQAERTRWDDLVNIYGDISKRHNGLEIATWRDRLALFSELESGETFENDVSVLNMVTLRKPSLVASDTIVSALDENSFAHGANLGGKRIYSFGPSPLVPEIFGDLTLSLPLSKNKTLPFRIFIPKGLDANVPTPLVIALHGAGGTENLFFEGYGAGQVVRECEKRKWIVISPRGTLNFTSGPPVKALIEELASRFPIDRKQIFIVGHSMGAAQTIALCQEHPTLFAAAAALGGGGRVKDAKVFETLPTFIGIGEKDFAKGGAKSLSKSMTGAKALTYKEYPDVEHLVIVREALPDVYALFDTVSKKR